MDIGLLAVAIGLGMGIAAGLAAIGQGRIVASSVEAHARQPEAGGKIFTYMIIGLAFTEALVIYTMVMAFILKANLTDVIKAQYGDKLNKPVQTDTLTPTQTAPLNPAQH